MQIDDTMPKHEALFNTKKTPAY